MTERRRRQIRHWMSALTGRELEAATVWMQRSPELLDLYMRVYGVAPIFRRSIHNGTISKVDNAETVAKCLAMLELVGDDEALEIANERLGAAAGRPGSSKRVRFRTAMATVIALSK